MNISTSMKRLRLGGLAALLATLMAALTISLSAHAAPIAMGDKGGWIGVTPQGTLVAWGNNDDNGLYVPRSAANNWAFDSWLSTPVRILPDQGDFIEVASVGKPYSDSRTRDIAFYALQSNGNLWSWGTEYSYVGDPTRADPAFYLDDAYGFGYDAKEMLRPPGIILTDVIHVTPAGTMMGGGVVRHTHALALKRDGTLWYWGYSTTVPTQVASGVISLDTSYALKSDGSLWLFYAPDRIEQVHPAGTFGPNDRLADTASGAWGIPSHYTVVKSDGTVYDSYLGGAPVALGDGVVGAVMIKDGKAWLGSRTFEGGPESTSIPFTNVALPIEYAIWSTCSVMLKKDGSVTAVPLDGVTKDTQYGHCGVGPNAAMNGEMTMLPAGSIRQPASYAVGGATSYTASATHQYINSSTTNFIVNVTPGSADVGKQGMFFAAVLLPSGQILTMNAQKQWAPFSSCTNAQTFQSATLATTTTSMTLSDAGLPTSVIEEILIGATFWAGYGLGSSAQAACDEMLSSGRIKAVCTVGQDPTYGTWGACS